ELVGPYERAVQNVARENAAREDADFDHQEDGGDRLRYRADGIVDGARPRTVEPGRRGDPGFSQLLDRRADCHLWRSVFPLVRGASYEAVALCRNLPHSEFVDAGALPG